MSLRVRAEDWNAWEQDKLERLRRAEHRRAFEAARPVRPSREDMEAQIRVLQQDVLRARAREAQALEALDAVMDQWLS
jgi:ribosome-associated translation inhibitor RaiA